MNNKHNLHFFEGRTMKDLYGVLDSWQKENNKRLLSINVQKEDSGFSCIALTNPSEVVICNSAGDPVEVVERGGPSFYLGVKTI